MRMASSSTTRRPRTWKRQPLGIKRPGALFLKTRRMSRPSNFKEARRALDKAKTARGYYPVQNPNGGKGSYGKSGKGNGDYSDKICMRCGKKGHIARICPQRPSYGPKGKGRGNGTMSPQLRRQWAPQLRRPSPRMQECVSQPGRPVSRPGLAQRRPGARLQAIIDSRTLLARTPSIRSFGGD